MVCIPCLHHILRVRIDNSNAQTILHCHRIKDGVYNRSAWETERNIWYTKHSTHTNFVTKSAKCLKCHLCSFRFWTNRHCQGINYNIFLLDTVFCCLCDNLLRNLYTSLGCCRDSVFIKCQANHNTAILPDQWEYCIHWLLLSTDWIDHRLTIVNAKCILHRNRINRINLKRKIRHTLKFLNNFLHQCRLVNIRKSYVNIQNMCTVILLCNSFF